MPIFKKSGDNLSRAAAILDGLSHKEGEPQPQPNGDPQPSGDPKPEPQPNGDPQPSGDPKPEPQPNGDPQPSGDPIDNGAGGSADPEPKPNGDPAPQPQPQPELTEEMILASISERLGKEVKSFDELNQPAAPVLDEELQELIDWRERTKLPLKEFANYNRDFSSLSDLDVVKEILATENPEFTNEELEHTLKDYIYDENLDSDGEKISKSIALKRKAREGRQLLESRRVNLKDSYKPTLSEEQERLIGIAQKYLETSRSAEDNQKIYQDNIKATSQALEAIDLNLSEDVNIKFNLPQEIKNSLPKMVEEMPSWFNEDGTHNYENIVKDVAKVANFDKIIKAAFEQGIAVGTEGKIKQGKNITIDGKAIVDPEGGPRKGNVLDVVDRISGSGRKNLRFRRNN